jgi:alkylation response protein AidB-like acyl-CoA dehydrogenase
MEFDFTEEQEEFRHEFRDWLDDNLPDGWENGDWQLPEDEDERIEFLKDWHQTKTDDGWAGPSWPEEYGGMGLSVMEEMIYEDELARVNAPQQINILGISLVGPTLIEMGTDWQKERFLPNILNAEEIWCQGYSEPEHGSDIAGLETEAVKEGDEFVINGQKIWTSFAHHADYCILMTRTDFSGTKHEGITALIVDMDQEGVSTERIHQASDGKEFNQMFFDDAVAPEEHVVGEVGQGWDTIRTISAYEQAGTRAFDLKRRLDELIRYCQNNARAGRPLAEYPHIRRTLAEFDSRIQAAKATRYRQVSERLDDPVPGPEGTMDQVTTDELAVDMQNFAVGLLGPEAALWEDGPEGGRWATEYLGTYGGWIAAGTGDIYRNIIGEQVLRLPKDIKSHYTHTREGGPEEPADD